MSSVGKKSSRLSQNVVLDFCLLYKVKKDIWGRQRYITQIFTWLTYLVSFVLKLKVKCCIDKQAFRFFTEFSKLPLEKNSSIGEIYCDYMTNGAFSLSWVGNSTKGLSPDLLLLGNKQVGVHNVIQTCIS